MFCEVTEEENYAYRTTSLSPSLYVNKREKNYKITSLQEASKDNHPLWYNVKLRCFATKRPRMKTKCLRKYLVYVKSLETF